MRDSWNTVLSRSADDSPFLTWEKMAASIKYLEKNQMLRILYVTDENKIVAIAPLRQLRSAFNECFGYNVIEPLAHGDTDYSGLILTERPTECLKTILTYLYDKDDWDFLNIYDIPETSNIFDLLENNKHLFPKFEKEQGIICPYIPIPNSIKGIKGSLSYNFRKNLRKSLMKLERDHGKVELREYCELGSLEDTVRLFFNLHQKRWTFKGEPGGFARQKPRDVYLQTAKLFAEKDWFALYFLMVNGEPVAAKYCLKYKHKLYGNLGGWDPDYSAYSVGHLIMEKILQKCIQENITEYDFLQGDESYKFKWSRTYRRNLNLRFVNRKFSSQLIKLGMEAAKRTKLDNLLTRKFRHVNSTFDIESHGDLD
jgi:hypothetical protein